MNMSAPYDSDVPSAAPTASSAGAAASVTDSPWFWLPLFLGGALLALVLIGPKYRWRRPQIKRQYQARGQFGQAVLVDGRIEPYSDRQQSFPTLRPLLAFFSLALLASAAVFWFRRFALKSHRAGRTDRPPAARGPPTTAGPAG